ncbi:MAG: 3-phosphoshikimate 1-carboxyvinyltransferase [bacterium]
MDKSSKKIIPAKKITGSVQVMPDKSITHRALMLSAVAEGSTIINNASQALDCVSTRNCLKSLGIKIDSHASSLNVFGKGRQGLKKPNRMLDAGNSGSTIRMLSGILAGQGFAVEINGDSSLQKRPMKRIVDPLRLMGAVITGINSFNGNILCPLAINGTPSLQAVVWHMNVASAQVKTAVLFAGINAAGTTTIIEPSASRDHTERMLELFGCPVCKVNNSISITGPVDLRATELTIPGDFSSAAFFIVLASLLPGSEIILRDVGVNTTRTGLISILQRMGADIRIMNRKELGNEPVGDIYVTHHKLHATVIQADEIPAMIDEIPILAVAASLAQGKTIIKGAGELKFKESNRLEAIAEGLTRLGADIQVTDDGLTLQGKSSLHGAEVDSYDDHRIAMSLAVAAHCADSVSYISHADCVDISFPGFWRILKNTR